jgi:hypothetical protein
MAIKKLSKKAVKKAAKGRATKTVASKFKGVRRKKKEFGTRQDRDGGLVAPLTRS